MKTNAKKESGTVTEKAAAEVGTSLPDAATETPQQRKKREREEKRQQELAEKTAKEAERLAANPARLFAMQVRVAELERQGVNVTAEVMLSNPERFSNNTGPGLWVRVGDDSDNYLSLNAEEWEFEVVNSSLDKEVQRMTQEKQDRALAEELKKRLKPEELEALRKYG